MMRQVFKWSSFVAVIFFWSSTIGAQGAANCDLGELLDCDLDQPKKSSGWRFGVGVATAVNIPDYIGSDESRNFLLPVPYISYVGEKLRIGQGGIVGQLFKSDKWFLSVSLSGAIPVDSDDNAARKGMNDLDAVFEYGPSLKYYIYGSERQPDALFLDLNVREARTIEFDNLQFSSSPSLVMRKKLQQNYFGGAVSWVARFRWEFVSDQYADYFYSVAPKFETANRPEYRAKGGSAGYRINSNIRWKKNQHVVGIFMAFADLNDAAFVDSPLVKTKQHWYGGMSYFWLFD